MSAGDDDEGHAEEGYTGEAELLFDNQSIPVEVELRGFFQPIDGRYHWYGRVAKNDQVSTVVEAGTRTALLRTPTGQAQGTLSDPDPWHRYRISGTSTPPFRTT